MMLHHLCSVERYERIVVFGEIIKQIKKLSYFKAVSRHSFEGVTLGSVMVKALCYKPEGRGIDTR
jgi:hypothetical protein